MPLGVLSSGVWWLDLVAVSKGCESHENHCTDLESVDARGKAEYIFSWETPSRSQPALEILFGEVSQIFSFDQSCIRWKCDNANCPVYFLVWAFVFYQDVTWVMITEIQPSTDRWKHKLSKWIGCSVHVSLPCVPTTVRKWLNEREKKERK